MSVHDGAVTQFAVLDALLAGTYESGMPVAEVRAHGDFGIGCCDRLGGEVVIVDGSPFECTLDAPPTPMADAEELPFAVVCPFPDVEGAPVSAPDARALTAEVERRLLSRNLFTAVRLDGEVTVRVRVTPRQQHPLPPLDEVVRQQVETVIERRRGTLVGFWTPTIYQGIGVAGLHLHFVSDDRLVGGHVLETRVHDGMLRLAAFARFELHLPTDERFLRTELTHDADHRIVAVESANR